MKLRGKVLNLKAVMKHLTVDRRLAEYIDELASTLDMRKTSLALFVMEDDVGYDFYDGDMANFKGKNRPGLMITFQIDKNIDYKIGPKITVPWDIIKKGSQDTGNLVYLILLQSIGRMRSTVENGITDLIPGVLEKYKTQSDVRIPFDVVTQGRTPAYVGKTSKGVGVRLVQHLKSSVTGSSTLFHRRLCGDEKYQGMIPIMNVIDSADTEEAAYDLEEHHIRRVVQESLNDFVLLNTIASREAINQLRNEFPELFNKKYDVELADEILAMKRQTTSNLWNDPLYAESVICNNERNFDADDVRQIRMMKSLGSSPKQIADLYKVNVNRITSLFGGKTYSRIF